MGLNTTFTTSNKNHFMKKFITLSIVLFSSYTFYAQSHLDSIKTMWNAKKRATAVTENLFIDYSDTSLCPTTLNSTTNYKHFWTNDPNVYSLSYDNTEKALRVDFKYPGSSYNPNYLGFGFNVIDFVNSVKGTNFDPFLETDSIIGVFVNMLYSSNQQLTLEYKTQDLSSKATISVNLIDADGKTSNGQSAVDTAVRANNQYIKTTFKWDGSSINNNQWKTVADTMIDSWSSMFWQSSNGRNSTASTPSLPIIMDNPLDELPLDKSKICGWMFTLDMGGILGQYNLDQTFTLFIKSIRMGNPKKNELIYSNLKFSQIPAVSLNSSKTTDIINLNNYLSSTGVTFSSELMQNSNLEVSISNGNATITQIKPCSSFSENVTFKASLNGLTTSTVVTVTQNEIIATPFTFNPIPNQSSGGSIAFPNLSLNQFINGAKSSQIITFTVQKTEPACTFIVNSSKELVATVIDPTWMGTAIATISAQDQCGLTASTNVLYKQNGASLTTFAEPANGTFALSSEMVQRYEVLQLFPSLTSASSVNWIFEGGTPSTSAYLSPTVKYAKPGTYKITLNAINNQGTTKIEKTIKVIGIEQKKTQTCANKAYTFTVNDNTLQYSWNSGATTQSITVTPTTATLYIVTATKNSKSFVDTVEIKQVQSVYDEALKLATINDNGKNVLLAWERTNNKGTAKYTIWREGLTNHYTTIGQLPFDSISIFIDTTADINKRAYKYKMTTTDTCGMESSQTNSVAQKTIHLQKTLINDELQLNWSLYEGATILGYKLLEGPTYLQMTVVDQFATDQTSYTITNPGTNKYRVVSIFADTISPTNLKSDSGPFSQSMSNMAESELTASKEMAQNIAIAALPNPTNGTFTCLVRNNNKADILLQVIDNLGLVVYTKKYFNTTGIEQNITIPAGSYFIKVSSNSVVKTIPLICY
jgi:hypothetical protein